MAFFELPNHKGYGIDLSFEDDLRKVYFGQDKDGKYKLYANTNAGGNWPTGEEATVEETGLLLKRARMQAPDSIHTEALVKYLRTLLQI